MICAAPLAHVSYWIWERSCRANTAYIVGETETWLADTLLESRVEDHLVRTRRRAPAVDHFVARLADTDSSSLVVNRPDRTSHTVHVLEEKVAGTD